MIVANLKKCMFSSFSFGKFKNSEQSRDNTIMYFSVPVTQLQ